MEWRYLGRQYFDLANTITQAPAHQFNALVQLEWRKLALSLWGRNLSDRTMIAYAYDFRAIHLAEPRTFGASLKLKW